VRIKWLFSGEVPAFFLQDLSDKVLYGEDERDQPPSKQKWLPARENGDWAEMGVRLKDLVEAAPSCRIFVSVSDTGTH
jgi:hypothetical protein